MFYHALCLYDKLSHYLLYRAFYCTSFLLHRLSRFNPCFFNMQLVTGVNKYGHAWADPPAASRQQGALQALLSSVLALAQGWVCDLTVAFCVANEREECRKVSGVNELLREDNRFCQTVHRTHVYLINLNFTQDCMGLWVFTSFALYL